MPAIEKITEVEIAEEDLSPDAKIYIEDKGVFRRVSVDFIKKLLGINMTIGEDGKFYALVEEKEE